MSEDSRSQDLARRMWTALAIPVVVMLVTALTLGAQLYRMSEDAHWSEHSERVLARAADVQRAIVDQESGLRGYIVTDDATFLELYHLARPLDALRGLRELVSDNPRQVARVEELTRRYEWWLVDADAVAKVKIIPEHRSTASMLARRSRMHAVRAAAGEFIAEEQRLREIRKRQSEASETTTRWVVVGLFVFATLALGWVSRRQLTGIAQTYTAALVGEQAARAETEKEVWIRAGQVALSERLQGDLSIEELGKRTLELVAKRVGCEVAAFFTLDGAHWKRRAALGLEGGAVTFARGEGLVGRAGDANDIVRIEDVPADYLEVKSGTGADSPREIVLVPARVDDVSFAVLEVAFLRKAEERGLAFLGRAGELVAAAVRAAEQKSRLRELLDESTRQGEELQAQQEELRVANEELAEQSNAVREANDRLNERKHELETINTRLEEQQQELETAQQDALQKAGEVERASQYKSEFLANMSHELRTPLNSSLILAKLLSENKSGNLTDEQVKFAQTIYAAGNDLLTLINDILDLSKIEAGKLDVEVALAPVSRIVEGLTRTFEPIARERGIGFEVKIAPDAPAAIDTDAHRVDQILKNLLSNAFKFTPEGSVTLAVAPFGHGLRFQVTDTGLGIAKHQQKLVFEAFRQADGGEARKYGGTGLGLSISRDLARLLGGEIDLVSELGRGSTFTLTLPAKAPGHAPRLPPRSEPEKPLAAPKAQKVPRAAFEDDRDAIDPIRRVVLVIEDDVAFAKILFDLAHELSFQCIVAHEGDAGFALAMERPPSAIILDINLPDRSGLSLLDRFKRTPALRHVPVHVVSVAEHERTVLSMGAVGYLQKPVQREALAKAFAKIEERLDQSTRRLLIVEDDAVQRASLTKLLEGPEIAITAVATVGAALEALRGGTFDTVVTDLALPDASGFDLLERMATDEAYAFPPTIVYTGRSLTAEEETRLRKYSSSIIVKGARSPERLVDEVTLFLHQVEAKLPPERQRMLAKARDRESVFEGRKVLVVEDDVRNVFALTSILEPKGAEVVIARNGREALDALAKADDIDLVLMDIMMPEMDGLTAMREIRKRRELADLPIIALTAKAMRDDQEKCLQAGANDYIAKPLDVEMLLSLLRVWMPK